MTVTTFTLPQELVSMDECDAYIALCEKKRASYAALPGAPKKKAVDKAWSDRIFLAKVRKAELR